MGLGVVNVAQVARLAGGMKVEHLRPEAVLIAHRELHPGLFPRCHHLFRVLSAVGHGFFTVDVLFCFKGGYADLTVRHVGGQDVDHLHRGVGQQIAIVGVHLGPRRAVLDGARLGPLPDDVAEGYDSAQVAVVLHRGEVLLVGNTAASDDADVQFAHDDPPRK